MNLAPKEPETQEVNINLMQSMRHSIEKRYFFPDIKKAEEAFKDGHLAQLDAYVPQYLAINCKPKDIWSSEDKEFIDIFNNLRDKLHRVLFYRLIYWLAHPDSIMDLAEQGVISAELDGKIHKFKDTLDRLNIDFTIVGAGGGGSNASRLFSTLSNYTVLDYDKVEVHNLPRVFADYHNHNKANCVKNGRVCKFDVNTTRRTLTYSGVDYHDRQTVCDNENIIAIHVGYTDDKCVILSNPTGDGIFTGDSYGHINTGTMMLNSYRAVEIFCDWFNSKSDEEIENMFTSTEVIADFSILDDEKVTENIFIEPITKSSYVPEFLDYQNLNCPIADMVDSAILKETLQQLAKEVNIDESGFRYIPMFKLNSKLYNSLYDTSNSQEWYQDNTEDLDSFLGTVYQDNFITERMEGTLTNAILEADYRLDTYPNRFLGIVMAVDEDTRVNILHPLTALKVIEHSTDLKDTYKFWIYMSENDMNGEYNQQEFDRVSNIVEDVKHIKSEPVKNGSDVDIQPTNGQVMGVANQYTGGYLLGLDMFLRNGKEQVPYYGYMVGAIGTSMEYLTAATTGNNSDCGNSVCTGDSDSYLFSSRYRQHMLNHQSMYGDSDLLHIPANLVGAVHSAINTSLDMYFEYFKLNDAGAPVDAETSKEESKD